MKAKSLINILRKTIKDKLAETKTNSSLIDLMSDDKVLEFAIGFDSYVKGIEQGKKDAEKKCPYATGIPPYFKKAKEKCIVVIGERDIIRKQTLSEVLKDLRLRVGKHNNWFFIRFGYIEELEQKLKAME